MHMHACTYMLYGHMGKVPKLLTDSQVPDNQLPILLSDNM